MVTSTQKQQPETQPTSAEEEALKRNTDCVYFLASPLTCKKGSECEYRHSEYARVNPRDCYYWLNGNCLNPKCGFRHPPLDGLYGNQAAASAGSTLPPPQTATLPSVNTSYNSAKQPVPCIFFQKGFCMKGDKCAFLHGPIPITNKVLLPAVPSNSIEPTQVKKAFGSLQKCTQEQKASSASLSKTAEPNAKAVKKAEFSSSRNGLGIERDVQPPKSIGDVTRHKATTLPTILNGNYSRSNLLHQPQIAEDHGFQNDKDADDHLRDSSPGFDVLVDDEEGEAEYYHGEDHYERVIGHEGRNSRSVDNYDMGHSADYNSLADTDQETYHDPRGSDSYERMQGYAWEQHRGSSDKMRVGATHLERGGYPISDSPERSDRLIKQRRGNGLRSVVSYDFVQDNQTEDRRSHRLPSHEGSISSRLRGRIKLPGRSPNDVDLCAEREMNSGRIWGRLSPGRAHAGRLHDRIKGRLEEDYNPEGRNLGGHRIRRELVDRNTDFAAPKSLAELKEGKHADVGNQHILGKRKQSESQQPEDLSFEGPLPLSEILKRKREADGAAFRRGIQPTNNNDDNQTESLSSSSDAQAPGIQSLSSHLKDENNNIVPEGKRELKSALTETDEVENVDVADDESLQPTLNEYETEDGIIGDDGMEYNEYEGDEQRDGDYEYEQDYEGEYNYEEGENAEGEEEYVDDEGGDDFAKKIGAVLS